MTWSGFRPSDDACASGYNIPAQLFAMQALRLIAGFSATVWGDDELAADARALASEIGAGVEAFGLTPDGGYAYEVDGLGNQVLMDDGNMPSLLSLPLTSDVAADDPRYLTTRSWVLSPENPYFYAGRVAAGIGSPHTPPDYVWPIAIAVRGLTGDIAEARRCLDLLLATTGGTGWMHEGFHCDDATQFTRPWFSWANSMACELMMTIVESETSHR